MCMCVCVCVSIVSNELGVVVKQETKQGTPTCACAIGFSEPLISSCVRV